ncbi:hypothetical protein AAZV13_17G227800 [Glycine max]
MLIIKYCMFSICYRLTYQDHDSVRSRKDYYLPPYCLLFFFFSFLFLLLQTLISLLRKSEVKGEVGSTNTPYIISFFVLGCVLTKYLYLLVGLGDGNPNVFLPFFDLLMLEVFIFPGGSTWWET